MKQHFSLAKIVFVLAMIVTIIGFSAFSQQKKGDKYSFRQEQETNNDDTTPSRKRNRAESPGDFDKLDMAMRQLETKMKELDIKLNKLDVTLNLKELNALKEVDMEKISSQIDESLKSIDWEKINADIEKSVSRVNKVKMEELKAEMKKVEADLKKQKLDDRLTDIKVDAEKIKEDVEKVMREAKEGISKAKEEIKILQEFTNKLQEDGLINKSKGYRLEVKDDELFIDGKKQSKEVNDKYRKYYRKGNFTLDMSEGDSFRL
jgi:vancomycin resistance protein YoaR